MDDDFTSRLEITYGPAGLVGPVGSADPVGFAGGLGAEPGPPIFLDLHPILRDFAHSSRAQPKLFTALFSGCNAAPR
ncbi:hypothetical protein ABZU76_03625 [Amycolatopsis sp. NPDC005232]|uniref:hypothetical protein n=1 Tax=Amycolatopsis sp. NPDC005232 TaxID=3157027 RepID=UPI0033AA1188